jgi:putative MATE family efflux protein
LLTSVDREKTERVVKGIGRDLTAGSIPKHILALAWPAITSLFSVTALNITDAFWVGRLGAAALAAVITAGYVYWIIRCLGAVVADGALAVVSRYIGAGENEKASSVSVQATVFSLSASIAIALFGLYLSPKIFQLLGTEIEVSRLGTIYLQIIFLATPFIFFWEVLFAIFKASGDTKTPMLVTLIAVGSNILLDPFLIFGIGPFPEMGTAGAATATLISYLLGALIIVYFLKKREVSLPLKFSEEFFPHSEVILQIVKIGLPLSLSGILFSVVYLFIAKITAFFGTEAVAALGVGQRAESISYMTCFGFSMAVSAIVGQNLGAKETGRAERGTWTTVRMVSLFTFFISIVFFVLPKYITSFFISEQRVIEIASQYLMILALSQIFMGLEVVLEGAFLGAGDTIPPMVISMPGSIVRIPLAYYLGVHLQMGAIGIWWAITLSTIAKGLLFVFWFKKGNWKRKKIK